MEEAKDCLGSHEFPVYTPWDESQLRMCRQAYEEGDVPVLYLELSAKCTQCRCLYCDSPCRAASADEMTLEEIISVVNQAAKQGLRWVYICGLGEPSEDKKLFPLLSRLSELAVRISMFTNGLGFRTSDIRQLKLNQANLILKLDTFQSDIFDRLLDRKGAATRIYRFLDNLLEESFVHVGPGQATNLAFSLVPTLLNLDTIPQVIQFCREHSIYPTVGEMEVVGRARENAIILRPSESDLRTLSDRISEVLGHPYIRPLCPGIIDGLHIDHIGNCVADSRTGLSCGWFIAEESKMEVIGNIRDVPISILREKVRRYRVQRLKNAVNILRAKKPHIACGGGARPAEWIDGYIRVMERAK